MYFVYCKLLIAEGLMHDDTLNETPEVKEALHRLPRRIQDERQFRITRALYLSMRKEILPKEEWTKWEEASVGF